MGKCKNIECSNETKSGRVYCSLTCRNVYVNKHLRDYSKISLSLEKDKKYYENPKKCENCKNIIPYKKRRSNFCNHSCAASIVNKKRTVKKYVTSEKGLLNKILGNKKRRIITESDYIKQNKKCENCNNVIPYKKRNNKFCDIKCRKEFERKNINEYRQYQLDCKFNFSLNQFPEEFNFNLIEKHGWYSASNSKTPNLNGVSRDHMFSISEGFKNKINYKIISHPANCKLLLHEENQFKQKGCSITIEELKERIENWEFKYINVYLYPQE